MVSGGTASTRFGQSQSNQSWGVVNYSAVPQARIQDPSIVGTATRTVIRRRATCISDRIRVPNTTEPKVSRLLGPVPRGTASIATSKPIVTSIMGVISSDAVLKARGFTQYHTVHPSSDRFQHQPYLMHCARVCMSRHSAFFERVTPSIAYRVLILNQANIHNISSGVQLSLFYFVNKPNTTQKYVNLCVFNCNA